MPAQYSIIIQFIAFSIDILLHGFWQSFSLFGITEWNKLWYYMAVFKDISRIDFSNNADRIYLSAPYMPVGKSNGID